ncbi:hypothetical protein [Neobacillus sp. 204]|uniref:hypothetical protein n=1 Tax=Neobacillus sp. 204 TaxID=3383351 RepID=UPI00397B5C86
MIGTTSFALAIETQGHIAGSASALLGLLPFVLGSISAPLVGIAGANSGIPMGVIIFSTSFTGVPFPFCIRTKGFAADANF